MVEHFSFFLSHWYVENFKEFEAVKTLYSSHLPMLGKIQPADSTLYYIGYIFLPWVSQIYLSLSCFNIANKNQSELSNVYGAKIKHILLLLFVFVLENFIVSFDFGQSISIYPVMLWMIVSLLITSVYRYFGLKGISILTFFAILPAFVSVDRFSDNFELLMKSYVHPNFDYDSRVENFLASGCIGFWIGYVYYQLKEKSKYSIHILIGVGLILVGLFLNIPHEYVLDARNPYRFEHALSGTLLGSVGIWGAVILVMSAFLLMEEKKIKFNSKIIKWIGVNSLFIFLCHKIFFLKVTMPVFMFITAKLGLIVGPTIYMVGLNILCILLMCYLILKYKITTIITKNNG